MILIRLNVPGAGGPGKSRRWWRFRKKKPLTDKRKAKIFNSWVKKMKHMAVENRRLLKKSPGTTSVLRALISDCLPAVKVEPYIAKINSGEIFSLSLSLDPGEPHFTVVPDGFLTGEERFALANKLARDTPGWRVFAFSEFKQWAIKNIDFAAVHEAFDF